MSVLTDSEIRQLVAEQNLIEHFDPDAVEGASYDMGLGHEYARKGEVHTLSEHNPTLTLEPGEFVILRSYEELNMPVDLIGHNGIMSPWAKQGLVSLFSPQIDPGFQGFLIVPVFNAGDSKISMKYRQKIFTVEFVRTSKPASYAWTDRFRRQKQFPPFNSPSFTRPDFTAIERSLSDIAGRLTELETAQTELKKDLAVAHARVDANNIQRSLGLSGRQVRIGILALIATVFGLAATVFGIAWSMRSRDATPSAAAQPTTIRPSPK